MLNELSRKIWIRFKFKEIKREESDMKETIQVVLSQIKKNRGQLEKVQNDMVMNKEDYSELSIISQSLHSRDIWLRSNLNKLHRRADDLTRLKVKLEELSNEDPHIPVGKMKSVLENMIETRSDNIYV